MMSNFPKPYLNSIPDEGMQPGIEYVDFKKLGIGARASGMPSTASTGPKSIDHVGSSAGGNGSPGARLNKGGK
jgi:hypothetical protein